MQTYSHLILGGVLTGPIGHLTRQNAQRLPAASTSALLLGSILPDLPLIILSIMAITRDVATGIFTNANFTAPAMGVPPELLETSMTAKLFAIWFFENPWVITAQNLFHSPLLLVIFIVLGNVAWRRGWQRSGWFFWLFCAALLHTLSDIPLHVNDGPLLLFPINWTLRFISPISYWDPNYFGREWSIFEHLLILVLLIYLGWHYRKSVRAWWQQRAT